jgi:hypothetical protein
MDENKMLESSTSAMVASVSGNALALWSEDKKKEFVGTFKDRVMVARFILEFSAYEIARIAQRRRFIGQRHWDRMFEKEVYEHDFRAQRFMKQVAGYEVPNAQYYNGSYYENKVGGRDPKELEAIAKERADAVLKSLPPIQEALNIIDPESAKMLDRIDALKAAGEKLKELVEEASEPIVLAEVDQKMTIGSFRKMVKDQDSRRRKLLEKMKEIGKEGSQLEAIVGKRLFKGLPGLSDAVMAVVRQHIDRSKGLDATSRRVEEQVIFGDCDAALELLRGFEKDEAVISESVKASFDAALEKLKFSVKRGRKALKGADA